MAGGGTKPRGRLDLAGLDIGERFICAARVRTGRDGTVEIRHAGSVDCPPGASERELAAAIRRLWRQSRMPVRLVCSSLRGPSLLVRRFNQPRLPAEELASALRLQAEEALQLPPAEIRADWHLYAPRTDGPGNPESGRAEGFMVAASAADVNRHLELLDDAGLGAAIVDIGCAAIANLYLALRPDGAGDEVVCLVNLNAHSADVAILGAGARLHPRAIRARTRSWAEAPESLVEDIRDELRYVELKLHEQTVRKLVVTGGMPAPRELAEHLGRAVGLPVECWNPLREPRLRIARAARAGVGDPELGPRFAASLGLALRGR